MSILCNYGVERAVLGGIFQHGADAYVDVSDLVSVNTFVLDSNQAIFKCLQYIYNKDSNTKLDLPTVAAAAKALGFNHLFEQKEERDHLRAISLFQVNKENVRKLAGSLKKLELAREAHAKLEEAQNNLAAITGDEPFDQIVSIVEKPTVEFTTSLYSTVSDDLKLVGDGLGAYTEHLLNNPVQYTGIPTGFKWYDETLGGGLPFGGSAIIAARQKVGKSLVGAAIGFNVAKLGFPVINLDTEMSWEGHSIRLLASLSGVEFNKIRKGQVNSLERSKIKDAVKEIEKLPYTYKGVKGRPFTEIASIIRRWILRKVGLQNDGRAQPCLVVYDYIKVMDQSELKVMSEWQLLGFQLDAVNNITGQYNTACLILAQTNRDGLVREDTGVIGGSDRIGQYCTAAHLLKEKSPEEMLDGESKKYNLKLIPLLSRYGELLDYGDYINIKRDGKISRMTEGPTRNEAIAAKPDTGFVIDDNNTDRQNESDSVNISGTD